MQTLAPGLRVFGKTRTIVKYISAQISINLLQMMQVFPNRCQVVFIQYFDKTEG